MSNLIPDGFIDVNGGLATLTFKRRLAHPIQEVLIPNNALIGLARR